MTSLGMVLIHTDTMSRQKMKVPELKELLTKHELPTTGRKEELVQRLLAVEQDVGVDKEQLLEPPV